MLRGGPWGHKDGAPYPPVLVRAFTVMPFPSRQPVSVGTLARSGEQGFVTGPASSLEVPQCRFQSDTLMPWRPAGWLTGVLFGASRFHLDQPLLTDRVRGAFLAFDEERKVIK